MTRALLLGLLLAALPACVQTECDSAADCAGGRCFAGRCRSTAPPGLDACPNDAACPVGLRCSGGGCRYVHVACEGDSTCRAGETCRDSHCVDAARACFDAGDCAPPAANCELNRCVSIGECVDARDCGLGEGCVSGRCSDLEEACDTDDDCEEGECDDGICVVP